MGPKPFPTFEISLDAADKIAVDVIRGHYEMLLYSLQSLKHQEDIDCMNADLDALERVLWYFTGESCSRGMTASSCTVSDLELSTKTIARLGADNLAILIREVLESASHPLRMSLSRRDLKDMQEIAGRLWR